MTNLAGRLKRVESALDEQMREAWKVFGNWMRDFRSDAEHEAFWRWVRASGEYHGRTLAADELEMFAELTGGLAFDQGRDGPIVTGLFQGAPDWIQRQLKTAGIWPLNDNTERRSRTNGRT